MKKLFVFLAIFFNATLAIVAQDVTFNPPFFQQTVKGDMIVVGNSILNAGANPNVPYTGTQGHNARIDLNYIDIDGDSSTFNSSSANVAEPSSSCAKKVVKAYLYWASAYTQERIDNQRNPRLERSKFNQVKFKVGNGAYRNLTGTRIYDGNHIVSSTGWGDSYAQRAYVYRADVTQYLTNIGGTYTVADIQAPYGNEPSGVGYAAGWTLVIVYEDLARESRNITLFNGFSVVGAGNSPDINISGFKTVPTGPVRAKIGFAALEGELGITGDRLSINGKQLTSVPARDGNNFFNSKVTNETGENLDRTPASTNLLGFDIGIFNLPNNSKDILNNNATSAIIKPYSTGDAYYPFFFGFSVEVITPHIVIEKRVFNASNQDVTDATNIPLNSSLRYRIRFRNIGNDDAKDLVITDILPQSLQNNITNITLPAGVTASAYNPATREIKFTVDNSLVKKGSVEREISFGVQVAASCDVWRDPCSNRIGNSVSAVYNGVDNPAATNFTASSVPQFNSCMEGNVEPSYFTVNVDFNNCAYRETITLCQPSTVLTAAAGFDSYRWEKTAGANPGQRGTAQTLNVSEAGTYKVTKTKAGCATMYEIYEVKPNPAEADHPIYKKIQNKEISGELYVCPDTGQYYPQIYLCGKNASVNLTVNIGDAQRFVWQKKGNCAAAERNRQKECPPSLEAYNCDWSTIHTDNGTSTSRSFTDEGDYRLSVTYGGAAGCTIEYYFKITKNNLDPKAEVKDIVCTDKGKITITGVPTTGYQFALLQGTTTVTNYQSNPVFDISAEGTYKVLIRQITTVASTVPCIFEINQFVKKRDPKLAVTVTPMACANSKGGMRIELSDPPYTPYSFVIRKDSPTGAEVYRENITGTTPKVLLELTNRFDSGNYFVILENNYGCTVRQNVSIPKIDELKATASVYAPILCGNGIIRVTASGGTKGSSYQFSDGTNYYNNFSGNFYDFPITTPGNYTFTVIDQNNCRAQASVNIQALPAPTVTITDALTDCGEKAKITFNPPVSTVTYTYEYSIDGTNFQTGREFINLETNKTYTPTYRYKYGTQGACTVSTTLTTKVATGGNLIASAGVAQLVGCGTGVNADKALVRFSNVQGGQPPYEYNFGDGQGWMQSATPPSRWLTPGVTYNLSVRDAIGCARNNIKVTVPNKITEPTFTPSAITYDCQGRGSVTINNNRGTYTYTYEIDGRPANSNTFRNLTPGTHTITIKYADANPPSKNVLFLEDFGTGRNGGNPYINKVYFLELQDGSTPRNGNGVLKTSGNTRDLQDGEYVVSAGLNPNNGAWWQPTDHSNLPQGRMFFVNIGNVLGTSGAVLYQRPIKDIIPNKEIKFSVALMNLLGFNDSRYPGGAPDLSIELYANEADITATPHRPLVSVLIDPRIRGARNRSDWTVFERALNPGNNTELIAVIRSHSLVTNGNDLAMDDIYLYQEPEACGFTHTLTINVSNDRAFGTDPATERITQPKCYGETADYQITLKNAPATYYVSRDGGAFVATTSNPFRWTNISVGAHTVRIRAEQNNANCEVTRTFTITQPAALGLNFIDNATLGCSPAAVTHQLGATGGVPPYTFVVTRGTQTITTIPAGVATFVTTTFTQTGDYRFTVIDSNGCRHTTTTPINVYAPKGMTVTGTTNAANNDFCNAAAGSGKVEVRVTTVNTAGSNPTQSSTAPYTYQVDGVTKAANLNANTYVFDNLNVGVHTFTVIDRYGCRATYAVELKRPIAIDGGTGATITKDISCGATPAARQGSIQLRVKDGYAPYRYVVKRNGNIVQNTTTLAGNTVTYQTDTPGNYTIEVTDSKGCTVTGAATLVAATNPAITYTSTMVGCYGANNGTISLTITGGKAPYTVFVDGVNRGAQRVFNNLTAKTYVIRVVDANNCERTENIAVTQPASSLKAFAVVTELIGCETSGVNKDKAKVRFTNVSGGTQPYQYRFEGNYSSNIEGWLPAGTHTITVRDSRGCELPVSILVPERIAAPTGTTYTVTNYDCNGKGTVVFTATPTTYNYNYIIDGKTATGTTATITGLAPGSYTVTIEYTQTAALDSNLLFLEDFGVGSPTCLEPGVSGMPCNATHAGNYQVTNYIEGSVAWGNIPPDHCNAPNIWVPVKDHTSNGTNPAGRFFLVDANPVLAAGELFYKRKVSDIMPGADIKYEFYALNLFREDRKMHPTYGEALKPNIQVRLVANNGTIIATNNVGEIPNSNCALGMSDWWHRIEGTLNAGSYTEFTIEFRSIGGAPHVWGNDLCLDDIKVYQVPKSCKQEITKQVVVPAGQEFKASVVSQTSALCKGDANGKVTFRVENLGGAGYRISGIDGTQRTGAGYTTPITAPTFEIDGLRAGVHTITFSNRNCEITRTVTITEPDSLTATATLSQPAMCSNNQRARVTITATGGTPPYTYTYNSGTPQTSNVFTNVAPGQPTFVIRDRNNCSFTISTPAFVVATPTTLAFTTSVTTCYSGNSDGVIEVRNITGNGNYKLKINNNPEVTLPAGATSYNFTNLTQGSYTITLADAYGCSTATNVRIYPSLNSTVRVTDQSCVAGRIDVVASGGNGTIEYAFKLGANTPAADTDFSATTFINVPQFTQAVQTWTVYVRSAACVKTHIVAVKKADAVDFTAQTVTPTCEGSANGRIQLNITKGDGNFTIRYGKAGTPVIATYAGIATNTYTINNVAAGVYSVTITDKYGCATTKSVTLQDMPALTADLSVYTESATCITAGSAATLTLTMSPQAWNAYRATGNSIFYSFDNGATWHPMPANPHYTYLPGVTVPGNTLQVRYATRPSLSAPDVCSTAATAYVVPRPLGGISVTTDIDKFTNDCTTAGTQYFTATVTIADNVGQPPFQFNINGGSYAAANVSTRTHVFTNLVVGRTYTFGVKDGINCETEYTQDLYANVATPAMTVALIANPACNGATTTATISIHRSASYTNTTTSATINWTIYEKQPGQAAGIVQQTGTAIMPAAGNDATTITPAGPYTLVPNKTYYVIVTQGTCEWGSRDLYVRELATLTATVSHTATITCDTDAVLEVINPTGGGGQYTYSITPAAGVTFHNPIITGSNRIVVSKDNIATPAMPLYPNAAYSFAVNITMTDQYGCSAYLGSRTLIVPPAPVLLDPIVVGCADGQYTLTIQVQAKTGAASTTASAAELNGYEYSIDSGLDYQDADNVFPNLVAGTYDLQIRDKSTGCIATRTLTITNALEADIALTTALGCAGGAAEITVKVDNGSTDYEYTYVDPSGTAHVPTAIPLVSGQYIASINAPNAGVYTITVRDRQAPGSCNSFTKAITVTTAERPQITTSVRSVTCAGGNDGVIYLTELNAAALGTFTYAAQGPAGAVPAASIVNREITGLTAGLYTITVTANGCSSTYTATVTQPNALTMSQTLIENAKREFSCATAGTVQEAQVTVPAAAITGGTAPYTIEFLYGAIRGTGNTFTIGNVAGGVVTITVTDANNCSTQTTVTIKPFEAFDVDHINFAATVSGTCNANETVQITATQSSGLPFTGNLLYYQGATAPTGALTPSAGGWQTANTFSIAPNNTYTFWLANVDTGCIISKNYTSADPNNFRIVNPQVRNVTCKGANDGTATFTLSNTVSTHVYAITLSPAVAGVPPTVTATGTTTVFNIANALAPNTYTITVRDNNTGCEQQYSFIVEEPTTNITASVTVRQATCAAAPTYNNGEIAIENVNGGWGTYQYYIGQATPGNEVWTSTTVATGLTPGVYRVLVRDNGGCPATLSNTVTIVAPTAISGTLTITNANCTNGTGAIGVRSVTGGEGTNYLYQLIKDGNLEGAAQTSTEFTNLSAGNYQVAISDAWGCTVTLTQSVTLYEAPVGIGVQFIKQVTCTPATGATISVTYQGGNSPSLRYTLRNTVSGVSTTSTTNGFTNVPAGNYEVSVFDVATGCPTQTHTFDVTDAATVSFTHTTTAVTCNGSSTGKLKITIPGSQTQTDYVINIVGAAGFTRSETVNTTPKDIEFEAMPAGIYTVTLTSSRNCTATETIQIVEPDTLIVSNTTTVTTHYRCDTDNNAQQAIIQAVAQGGTAPYRYNYEVFDGTTTTTSGWITSSVYSLTNAGNATQTVIVNVEDANGCRAVYTPMVVPPLQRISDVNVLRTQQLSCNQAEQVNFTIVGGMNQGYNIEVTNSGSGIATPATQTLTAGTNVATVNFNDPGYYTIKITDLNTGCYTMVSYTVNEFRTMEVTATQGKPVSCVGGSNGEIALTFSGYQGPVTYQVYSVSPTLTPIGTSQTQAGSPDAIRRATITGLPKGNYIVVINQTTAPNCTVSSSVVIISEPTAAISVTTTVTDRIKCGVNQTGAFSVETTGGWGNYEYRLERNGTADPLYGTYTATTLFEGLSSATYTVFVKDENGCETTTTQVMAPPVPIDATVTNTNVECFSARTGSITLQNVTGGSGNYTYQLKEVGGDIIRGSQSNTTFSDLDARSYEVIITDDWGCELILPVQITEPDELNVLASIASPLTCNNPATVSITVTGGTPPYKYYQVGETTALGSNSILVGHSNKPLGNYSFYVEDNNGCRSKVSNEITIAALEPLVLNVNEEDALVRCNGEASARITFSATGALGNYQYKLYKGGVAQTATATQINATDWAFGGLTSGTYIVEVTSVDCVQSKNVDIIESPALVATSTKTDISCNGLRDGTISVTVTGGKAPIQYAINVGDRLDRFVSEGYFDRLPRGEYIVRAQDANGCFLDQVFKIEEPLALEAVVDKQTNEVCLGAADGSVSITITGGTQSYSTSIDGQNWVEGKTLYTGLASGTYTIFVKDARSCTTQVSATILEGVDLQATATVSYGCGNNTVVNTIIATVNATHTARTTFSLDGGLPQQSGRFVGVTPGLHTITFAHIDGCTTTLTVNVDAYSNLTATTATKTDMSCYGVNDGTITFAVTGATNSYTYTITPEAGTFDGVNMYTGLSAGTYIVKVRSEGQINCELEQTFTIVEPDLLRAFANTVPETCYNAADGRLGFSITGGNAPYSYTLKDSAGNVKETGTVTATGAVHTVTNVAGVYTLEYSNSNGSCVQSLEITVPQAPKLTIVDVKEQFNCSVVSTTYTTSYLRVEFDEANERLTASSTQYSIDGGMNKLPFKWFDGKYGYTDTIPTGSYSLTVYYQAYRNSTYCTEVWGETVSITRYPGLEIEDKSDPRAINSIKVQAKGGNSGNYTYYFNGFSNGSNEYMLRPTDPTTRVVGNRVFKTVVVEVVDANGCSSTLSIEKEFMKSVPPDFFTPNGDGQNDGWDPDKLRSYPHLTVDIYDRYGRYITTLRSGQVWDGRYNGKEMPTGDYWYILKTHEEGVDDLEYMGHFNLYRAAD